MIGTISYTGKPFTYGSFRILGENGKEYVASSENMKYGKRDYAKYVWEGNSCTFDPGISIIGINEALNIDIKRDEEHIWSDECPLFNGKYREMLEKGVTP